MKSSFILVLLTVILPTLPSCKKEVNQGIQYDQTQRNVCAKVVSRSNDCPHSPTVLKLLSGYNPEYQLYDFTVYARSLPDSLKAVGLVILIDFVPIYQDERLESFCGKTPLNQIEIADAVKR